MLAINQTSNTVLAGHHLIMPTLSTFCYKLWIDSAFPLLHSTSASKEHAVDVNFGVLLVSSSAPALFNLASTHSSYLVYRSQLTPARCHIPFAFCLQGSKNQSFVWKLTLHVSLKPSRPETLVLSSGFRKSVPLNSAGS